MLFALVLFNNYELNKALESLTFNWDNIIGKLNSFLFYLFADGAILKRYIGVQYYKQNF